MFVIERGTLLPEEKIIVEVKKGKKNLGVCGSDSGDWAEFRDLPPVGMAKAMNGENIHDLSLNKRFQFTLQDFTQSQHILHC